MRMPKYATILWAWHSSSPVQCSTPVVHSTVPFHHSTPSNSHSLMRMPKYATNLWAWHSSSPVQCSTPVVHSTVPFHHSTPPNSHSRMCMCIQYVAVCVFWWGGGRGRAKLHGSFARLSLIESNSTMHGVCGCC